MHESDEHVSALLTSVSFVRRHVAAFAAFAAFVQMACCQSKKSISMEKNPRSNPQPNPNYSTTALT